MHTRFNNPGDAGLPVYPIKENIPALVNTAWALAMICLWPETRFSAAASAAAKGCIRRLIINEPDPYKAWLQCCQRILLSASHSPGYSCEVNRYTPAEWFHPANTNGYLRSLQWFEQLQARRVKTPLYLHELKAFCEAILDMAEESVPGNDAYWINWFGERDGPGVQLLAGRFTIFYTLIKDSL